MSDQITKDIQKIKDGMAEHNLADDIRFKEILDLNKNQTAILNQLVEDNKSRGDALFSIGQKLNEHIKRSTPLFEWFEEMTLGKKIKLEWLGSTSRVGGVILVIIAVLSAVWVGVKFIISQALTK